MIVSVVVDLFGSVSGVLLVLVVSWRFLRLRMVEVISLLLIYIVCLILKESWILFFVSLKLLCILLRELVLIVVICRFYGFWYLFMVMLGDFLLFLEVMMVIIGGYLVMVLVGGKVL